MRNANVGITTLLGLAILLLIGPAAHAAPDPLAGTWKVTITSDDSGKSAPDTLTIPGGERLSSQWAAKQGFAQAIQLDVDTRAPQARAFTGTAKAAGGATIKWVGTATLGEITGTVTVTKADGSSAQYTFKGTRQEK
ncbi:MAG: hypothetical protein ACAI43_00980 [Phycisphaerae bacterium]|nr:hypothetical protein [Tepidisphaeraceae bacterium]